MGARRSRYQITDRGLSSKLDYAVVESKRVLRWRPRRLPAEPRARSKWPPGHPWESLRSPKRSYCLTPPARWLPLLPRSAVWGTRTCRRRCVALGSLFVCGNYDSLLRAWRALLLASGHTCCGDLSDVQAAAHVSMARRWRSVATCHRARFCSVVDSKRRYLATRPCGRGRGNIIQKKFPRSAGFNI